MKKTILFLSLLFIFLLNINANDIRIVSNPYRQTQSIQVLNNPPKFRKWIKEDSTKVIFDFNGSKIIINNNKLNIVYKLKLIEKANYEISNFYYFKGVDSNKNKYDIQVFYYLDKSVFMIISNKYNVVRYKCIYNA